MFARVRYASLRLPLRQPGSGARWLAAALCAAALASVACDDASGGAPEATPAPLVQFEAGLPVVMSVRVVCQLASDTPSAVAAQITGADGSQSVVAGGRSYWFFGDTVRKTADRQDVIPAAVATTDDVDARDCLDLRFKTVNGSVAAMFPRLDETTAWPDGVLALEDGSIVFYMVKAYRESPFAWHVGSVGLGRIPAGSVDGERVAETIWDERSGFAERVVGVRSPVRIGDDVLAYVHAGDGNYIARAPLARMAEFGAYTYWDGAAWSPDPAAARAMWTTEPTGLPADNGVQVSYDERIGKWIALYNREMVTVEVRTADEPWGPWSAPLQWFDCRPLVREQYPFCYTGELHRQLTRDGGETLYMTISSQEPYDVTLLELHMATAVHEWRSATGLRRYAATKPGAEYEDAGVAFYASSKAAPGLSPVYEAAADDGYDYVFDAPSSSDGPVFFAYSTQPSGAVAGVPVRRVEGGALVAGAGRGDVRFFVPCTVAACE